MKGFNNPHIWVDEDKFDVYGEHYDAFEAGAAEYERCIWKLAKESPTGTFVFNTHAVNVFIEEE